MSLTTALLLPAAGPKTLFLVGLGGFFGGGGGGGRGVSSMAGISHCDLLLLHECLKWLSCCRASPFHFLSLATLQRRAKHVLVQPPLPLFSFFFLISRPKSSMRSSSCFTTSCLILLLLWAVGVAALAEAVVLGDAEEEDESPWRRPPPPLILVEATAAACWAAKRPAVVPMPP